VKALFLSFTVVFLATACGHTETGARRLTGLGISVDLPRGWHGQISTSNRPALGAAVVAVANRRLGVRVVLSETLRSENLPVQAARIERNWRLSIADRYFLKSGRAFWLHATFGTRPPAKRAIRSLNAVLGSLNVERRERPLRPAPDPQLAKAFVPPRLLPLPARVVGECRRAQARASFPILCPRRLPRPFVKSPVKFAAYVIPGPAGHTPLGLGFGYGAPWEPDSGPDWRLHLWRNRPCCFLHFEVFRRASGRRQVPAGARRAILGGRRGLLKDATSWGLGSSTGDYLYFPNHTRFVWSEHGVDYVATLHRMGTLRETRALLARLIRELRPVADL